MSAISSQQYYQQVAQPFVLQAGNHDYASSVDASLHTTTSYSNDTDAASAGVPIGGVYRNGNFIMVRLT